MSPLPELPVRAQRLPLATLIELYLRHYRGRDGTRGARLGFWRERLGHLALEELTDDHVFAAKRQLASEPARRYCGLDVDGRPVYKARSKPRGGATVNRYVAALGACITWGVRQRITPAGYVHPVRAIEREAEPPGRTRYLTADERARLLEACKASKWPRLYLFVLMGISTGARRGELLGLRWRNVDLAQRVAHIEQSKNTDKRTLPLIASVVEELQRFRGKPDELVFPARLRPDRPMAVEERWRQACKAAQIRGLTIHGLRHTTASYLAQSGASAIQVADYLGHRTLAMAKRYSHLNAGHRAELVDKVMGDLR